MKTELAVNINDSSKNAIPTRSARQEASISQNLKNGMLSGGIALVQLTGLGTVLVLQGVHTIEEQLFALAVLAESTALFGRQAFLSIREAFKKIAALENANRLATHGVFSASKVYDTNVTTTTNVSGRINRK